MQFSSSICMHYVLFEFHLISCAFSYRPKYHLLKFKSLHEAKTKINFSNIDQVAKDPVE